MHYQDNVYLSRFNSFSVCVEKDGYVDSYCEEVATVRRKILTVENIDEFDEFSAIRQYFPYQNFPFS